MGTRDERLEGFKGILAHPQLGQAEHHLGLIEQTHHNALAKEHRNHTDTHVNLLAANLHINAAVLGKALFRDVHVGHDLDTRKDRRLESVDLGRQSCRLQHAVNTVANRHPAFVGFDVDIAGPGVDRFEEDLVDELDHARFLGLFEQVVGLAVLDDFEIVADHLIDGIAPHAIVGFDDRVDLLRRRENGDHLQPGHQAKLVERVQIVGVAGGDFHKSVAARERHELFAMHQPGGQRSQRLDVHVTVGEIHHVERQMLAENTKQVFFRDMSQFDQPEVQAQPALPAQRDRTVQLVRRNHSAF